MRSAQEHARCDRCGRRPGALLSFQDAAACLSIPIATLRFYAYRLRLIPITKIGLRRGVARVTHRDLETLIQAPAPARLRRIKA